MRRGIGQRPFPCLKFRTMHTDAEERQTELVQACPDALLREDAAPLEPAEHSGEPVAELREH